MKKYIELLKKPTWLLPFCMIIVIVFSLFANMANTSFYSVSVKKVNFETQTYNGNMEGLLYTPKGCDAENPCPVIVTTHGYLNSKEMQDAPAIELSKRGYIVLAVDMYDHGGSTWDTPAAFSFFSTSVWDAAKWAYDQDFTLKDANKNGMIAVSGHSMGGFSTELAVRSDESAFLGGAQDHRKIAVSLSVGADYRYTSESIIGLYGPRSSGMIIAHFDEFFGDDGKYGSNTVQYKNYIETEQGIEFLGGETNLGEDTEYVDGKMYEFDGGQRVIYTPYEIHPWNHFSTETTGFMIDFYDQAFEYQLAKANLTDAFVAEDVAGQTWWLKEAFEFVALIALLVAVLPALNLLLKVPFFATVVTTEEETAAPAKEVSKGKRIGLTVVALVTSLIPAYFFPTFINRSADGLASFTYLSDYILKLCAIVTIGAWLIYMGVKMVKGEEAEENARKVAWNTTKGAITIAALALLLRFVATRIVKSLKTGHYFNAPTANDIGFWALISASISLLVVGIVHFTARKRDGATAKDYGLKAGFKQVLMALLISVILFVGLYLVVFVIEWIFNTDFRIWVYAIKSFKWTHFVSFLRYVPVYFVFYFVNSLVVAANTKDVKGWKGYVYALFLNVGGLVIFLAVQYGRLFLTGTAGVPNLALPAILVFGLVPTLAVAAIYAKKFAEKTNNIWTSAFFNTFLFTMVAIANTAVYLIAM